MARNGSGVYTLPEPPFVPNTPISSAEVNNDLSDVAAALTGSVAADGQTTITAALKLDNAGIVYGSDPNTGVRRTGADTQAIFAGGVDVAVVTTAGVDFPVTATIAGQQIIPAGVIGFTAAPTAPPGWLLRDGSAVSRTTYAALFSAIGTTFGSGNGSTTFNVPDARGRVDAGEDPGVGRLPGYFRGVSGGAASVAITVDQVAPHTHSGGTTGMSANNPHQHLIFGTNTNVNAGTTGTPISVSGPGGTIGTTATDIEHGHNFVTNSGNGLAGNPHSNVQPTTAYIPIIKT